MPDDPEDPDDEEPLLPVDVEPPLELDPDPDELEPALEPLVVAGRGTAWASLATGTANPAVIRMDVMVNIDLLMTPLLQAPIADHTRFTCQYLVLLQVYGHGRNGANSRIEASQHELGRKSSSRLALIGGRH